jgi:hypothetical protein
MAMATERPAERFLPLRMGPRTHHGWNWRANRVPIPRPPGAEGSIPLRVKEPHERPAGGGLLEVPMNAEVVPNKSHQM